MSNRDSKTVAAVGVGILLTSLIVYYDTASAGYTFAYASAGIVTLVAAALVETARFIGARV